MPQRATLILLLVVSVCAAQAQETPPTPEQFLGHPLGSRWTPHARLVAYCRILAQRSARVHLEQYGETWEHRPLLLLSVTSAANQARMTGIHAALQKLADPRLLQPRESAQGLVSDLPVVVWLSYNVHGNEPSPSEACMKVLYRLAVAQDARTRSWLSGSVVLLDPCVNPDGRDRYVNWFNGVVGRQANEDLQAQEHREPWPGGRTNHYYFDLNRDWAFLTQIETRARIPRFVAWKPQVHVDFHEMGLGSSYFFFPAEKPINSNLPQHTLKWGRIFGRGNAAAFDAKGWRYFTAEDFDLFYPGYGDSWPSFTGAIGMTYEQAGHSTGGVRARRRDGSVLTLRQRLEHHAESSFATIETAVRNRQALLLDYHEFRRSALEEGLRGPLRAYLLPPADDPGRLRALVQLLTLQGIEVKRARAAFSLRQVRAATGGTVQDRTFAAGTAVVLLAQPLKRLAKTLLEGRTRIKELFFYDVAAWSLPLAYGLQAFESAQSVPVPLDDAWPAVAAGAGILAGDARVGWLLRYGTRGALEALVDLLSARVKVSSARKPFAFGNRHFERGTLFIRRTSDASDLEQTLRKIGQRHGLSFIPVSTGYTDFGIDLGSQSMVPIVRPRIAVCGGRGISSASLGATRYLLDQVLEVPHSVLPINDLAAADLTRYSALVIPEGRVPPGSRSNLDHFTRQGGIVVAFGRAAFSMTRGKPPISQISSALQAPKAKQPAAPPVRAPRWIAEREAEGRKQQQPGSIFRVELDPSHPLNFGYRSEIAAFKSGTRSFDPRGPGLHVGLFKRAPEISGYVSREALKRLEGRSFLSVDPRGRGAYVLFAADPNFRGAWRGLSRLFLNAILLLPSRQPTWPPQVR